MAPVYMFTSVQVFATVFRCQGNSRNLVLLNLAAWWHFTSGAIGLPENPPRFCLDKKRSPGKAITRFASNLSAASRGDPIKSYRCTALKLISHIYFKHVLCAEINYI